MRRGRRRRACDNSGQGGGCFAGRAAVIGQAKADEKTRRRRADRDRSRCLLRQTKRVVVQFQKQTQQDALFVEGP